MKANKWWVVLAAVTAFFCSNTLFAWSANGHKIIAQIAWDRLVMDAAAKPSGQAAHAVKGIKKILKSLGSKTTLADISVCADELRRLDPKKAPTGVCKKFIIMPQSEPWHFIDIPSSDTPQGATDLKNYCVRQNCVLDQIRVNLQVLQNTTDLKSLRQSLMFLVHFVGDAHQPLHCATEITDAGSDRGGNGKPVTLTLNNHDYQLNLHSLWDHQLQSSDNLNDPVTLSQQLEGKIPSDTTAWTAGDFITDMGLESFHFSQNNIYPDFYAIGPDGAICQGNSLDVGYQTVMSSTIEHRLQLAGVRLEALLEEAFKPSFPRSIS
jgi:hypothetical protein